MTNDVSVSSGGDTLLSEDDYGSGISDGVNNFIGPSSGFVTNAEPVVQSRRRRVPRAPLNEGTMENISDTLLVLPDDANVTPLE